MLAAYPQTLAESTRALAGLSAPAPGCHEAEAEAHRRRNDALVVVSGEQRILQSAIDALDAEIGLV